MSATYTPNQNEYKNLTPFKCWLLHQINNWGLTNFPFVESDFDELTNYGMMMKLMKALNDVISNQNEVEQDMTNLFNAFTELQSYVNNYFDNLDVQDEINNKLDEMAESGQLADIIAQYLGLAGMIVFNNVEELKQAQNLVNGSKCQTLGYYNVNDGGGAVYKVRNVTNEDVEDDMLIIALNDNTLVAELIYDEEINVLQIGLDPTGENDNQTRLQGVINKLNNKTFYFPLGTYKFSNLIDFTNKVFNLKGENQKIYGTTSYGLIFDGTDGLKNVSKATIENLILQNGSKVGKGIISGGSISVKNCVIIGFAVGIECSYKMAVIENCDVHYNKTGIKDPVDSRIVNNTINANDNNGILLSAGANDNIIDSNKIEWNGEFGVNTYQAVNIVISNNVIDRNTKRGLEIKSSSKYTITGNLLRRNNISDVVTPGSCQVIFESCHEIIFSSNTLAKGNSMDDGSGIVIPQYAMYITACHDLLSIGNSFVDSCVQSNPITLFANTGNVQFLDLQFDLAKMMTHTASQGSLTTSNPLTLEVSGTNTTNGNTMPMINKFNYAIRRTDQGAYEVGEVCLTNFPLWGSLASTSAKMNITSFMNGNITSTISYNRETSKYSVVFTSTSGNYDVRLTPIDI